MYISEFIYHKPATLEEACKLLENEKNAAPIAGGTDILVEIKKGLRHNDNIISLSDIKDLKRIEKSGNEIFVGATATHNEIKNSKLIRENIPAVAEAASLIGSDQIRNTATVGGNLCTGASCCDMAPVLIASDASVEIISTKGKRVVALKDFFVFHRETSIAKGEIMTKIIVPVLEKGTGVSFHKFGLRDASAISVVSASAMIRTDGVKCTDSCIVIGAVAPTPKISIKASEILKDKKLDVIENDDSVLAELGEQVVNDSVPIDDIRGSAEFRSKLVSVLSRRAVHTALLRARKSLNK
jgi:carbon-monoxide dehydrogenase medium subunit